MRYISNFETYSTDFSSFSANLFLKIADKVRLTLAIFIDSRDSHNNKNDDS